MATKTSDGDKVVETSAAPGRGAGAPPLWAFLLRLALIAFGAYFLWRVKTIVVTVLVAQILACAAGALVAPLMRRRWVRGLSLRTQRTLATTLVFVFLALVTVVSVRSMIQPFQQEYAKLRADWPRYQAQALDQIDRARDWYATLPPNLRQLVERQQGREPLPSFSQLLPQVLGTTATWAAHIVELILIPVLAFYFTLDGKRLRNEFLVLLPRARLRPALALLNEGGAIMRTYIIAQFWLAAIAGVAVGLGLWWIGMSYALILGIFAGITRAIPVIGPLLGGIPIVLLAFADGAQKNAPLLWVWVLVFFSLLHLIESKAIMPKFLSHRLHLHAAVILIALLIGGEFFGLMGMFLAAPVAALVRVVVAHYLLTARRGQGSTQTTSSAAPLAPLAAPSGRLLRVESGGAHRSKE